MKPSGLLIIALVMLLTSASAAPAARSECAGLSLEEKVGQIMMCSFKGPDLSPSLARLIEEKKIGGIILYSSWGNITSADQVRELCEQIQDMARRSGVLPLFTGIDQEGGVVARIREGVSVLPGNMAIGAAGDKTLAAAAAAASARELAALGINMNFAPVADVNNNPLNPVIGVRSFGSSPELVSELAVAMAGATLEEGVIPVGKHFPGHGNTTADSHAGLPSVPSDMEALERIELAPFKSLIKSGIPAIMTAHVLVPALDKDRPATLSPAVIGMLRKEMGFGGAVITDSLGMGALKKYGSVAEVAVEAFRSGADILLFGADRGFTEEEQFAVYEKLLEACKKGVIPPSRLDEAVGRIIALKQGISRQTDRDDKKAPVRPFREDPSISKLAAKSVTLVRGWDRAAEMIKEGRSVPLLWPADHEKAGRRLAKACPFFKLYLLPQKPGREDISGAVETLRGEPAVFAAEYDCWKEKEWLALLKELGEERLYILSARTPYSLLDLPRCGGFFALYSDIDAVIDALADILHGRAGPEGRLPVDIPGLYRAGWGEDEF
ncbi:MAG: glycoside hydrolase family 3 protein [Aminivibrio sp.]|jgi:beta-N-acetylhexosaminidase